MEKNLNNVEFIAEIASSHNGSTTILKKLVDKLIISNIDTVKFQIFDLDKLAHPTYKFYKILKKISISKFEYEKLIKKLIKKNKKIIIEPFDLESFNFCKKFKKKISVKISVSDKHNDYYIKTALKNFDRVFISISGLKISSVEKIFKRYKKSKKLIFTYGFQSFPSDPDKIRLGFINEMHKKGMEVCYADHTSRDNIFQNISIINQAIKSGSNIIEKHVILDKSRNYIDKVSSLDVNELINLKNFFSQQLKNNKNISIEEKKYSMIMERNGVFLRNLNKGQSLFRKDIIFLRTGKPGLSEEDLEKFYKKELKNNVKKGQIIRKKYFY